MAQASDTLWRRIAKPTVYAVGIAPAVWLFWLGIADQLGADPMKTLERSLGLWALRFVVAGLAVSPLRRLGGPNLIGYRRALGLLAFAYACLHLFVYTVLDQGLDWPAIWADIVKRPYITIGFASFLVMVPLAITSNDTLVRRLGAAAWQRLHRWVYAAALAAAVHFLLVVKGWPLEPLIYTGLIVGLLLFRALMPKRRRQRARPAPAGTAMSQRERVGAPSGGP